MKTFNQLLTEVYDEQDVDDLLRQLAKDPNNEVALEKLGEVWDANQDSPEYEKLNAMIKKWEKEHDNPKVLARLRKAAKKTKGRLQSMLLAPLEILMSRGYKGTTS